MKITYLRPSLLTVSSVLIVVSSASAQPNAAPDEANQGQGNRNGGNARGNGPRQQNNGKNQGKRQGKNAQGQNAQGQGGGDATAFAQIGNVPKQKVPVPPPDAPQDVTMKPSKFPIPAGAIFVSPNAKPNGAGTQASPATLQNALKNAPEGGTVVLRGGLYRDGGLVMPRRLTVQGYMGESAWLDGSDIVTGWVQDGQTWRHDGWNFAFAPIFDSKDIDPAYPLANNRDMAWLNGRYLTQVGTRGEVGPSKFFVDYTAKQLFIGDDPTGKTVEATTRVNGLTLRPRDAEKVAGSVIRGLGLRRFADAGLQVSAPRVVIENCTAAWNGIFGAQITGGGTPNSTTDVVLRGVNMSCNGKAGARVWGAPRLLVENSVFAHNNVEGYRRAWGAAGIKLGNSANPVFRHNVVAGNYSFGLWLDENANDATIVNNEFKGNAVAGLMFEISHRVNIAFNVMHDNNVGLMVSNSTEANIFNNTFADNKTGANIKQGRRPNHQTPEEGDIFLTRQITLQNNLFAATDAKAVLLDAGTGAASAPEMITASDFNFYAPAVPLALAKWKTGAQTQNFQNLGAFRAATGQEKNSVQADTAPFVASQSGDYRLKPGAANAQTAVLPSAMAQAAGVTGSISYVGALAPAS